MHRSGPEVPSRLHGSCGSLQGAGRPGELAPRLLLRVPPRNHRGGRPAAHAAGLRGGGAGAGCAALPGGDRPSLRVVLRVLAAVGAVHDTVLPHAAQRACGAVQHAEALRGGAFEADRGGRGRGAVAGRLVFDARRAAEEQGRVRGGVCGLLRGGEGGGEVQRSEPRAAGEGDVPDAVGGPERGAEDLRGAVRGGHARGESAGEVRVVSAGAGRGDARARAVR